MADSVAIKVILIGLTIFSLTWLVLAYTINIMTDSFTTFINQGIISVDTVSHMNTALYLWILSPVIFLLGLIFWTLERAKGTDISEGLFYMYECVLIIGIFLSIMFCLTFGTIVDMFYAQLFTPQLVSMILPKLNPTQLFNTGVKIIYVYCLFPAIFGSGLYLLHPTILQTDSMIFGNDGDSGQGEHITNWQQI